MALVRSVWIPFIISIVGSIVSRIAANSLIVLKRITTASSARPVCCVFLRRRRTLISSVARIFARALLPALMLAAICSRKDVSIEANFLSSSLRRPSWLYTTPVAWVIWLMNCSRFSPPVILLYYARLNGKNSRCRRQYTKNYHKAKLQKKLYLTVAMRGAYNNQDARQRQ